LSVNAHFRKGEEERAMADFRTALALDPNYEMARTGLR
jgi:hypothetical protein